jgi:hypothetical protein
VQSFIPHIRQWYTVSFCVFCEGEQFHSAYSVKVPIYFSVNSIVVAFIGTLELLHFSKFHHVSLVQAAAVRALGVQPTLWNWYYL